VYRDLYVDDFVLPTGNLREPASGAKRADVIIVTKCPAHISVEEQQKIGKKLKLQNYQTLFFSFIAYQENVFSITTNTPLMELKNYTLVTGIANPKPLLNFLKQENPPKKHLAFQDHHHFTDAELDLLNKEDLILTTEKDFTRLKPHLPAHKLFYIPIEMKFINQASHFDELILNYISSSSQTTNT
jgi:tetraacyldisaccharide 4'-kinase